MSPFETFQDAASGQFIIPTWEVVFYAAVITVYASLGRSRSCLINTFAFTFYWGFMFLLPTAFAANTQSQGLLLVYLACGFLIYGYLSASDLKPARKTRGAIEPENPGRQRALCAHSENEAEWSLPT